MAAHACRLRGRPGCVALLDVPSARAPAWGFEAHKFIAEQMIALLPAELRPLFEQRKAYLIERCVDPDLWRTVGGKPRIRITSSISTTSAHYPFAELPREYDRAVQKFGREVDPRTGTAAVARCRSSTAGCSATFEGLKRAATRRPIAQDNIVLFSAILAHYVEDGHVPLHSVVNYDGQRTTSTASTAAGRASCSSAIARGFDDRACSHRSR